MIQPQGRIRLVHCPLTIDNKNQLTFANEQAQYNYFMSLDGVELDSSTYQRRDNYIRFNNFPENIMDFNYCMYQNAGYSGKWFYAFVVKKEYINDGMCHVYIQTDSFQTWQYRMNFKPSFVEREMILNDSIGNNLVPENLESGEHVPQSYYSTGHLNPVYIVAYAEDEFGHSYNGVFSGIQFYAFSDVKLLRAFLVQVKLAGKDNLIQTIFTVPKLAFNPLESFNGAIEDDIKAEPKQFGDIPGRPNNLNGYVPKNNKLLTYPYTYLTFNPSDNVYRFEDFKDGKPIFNAYCELNINPEVKFLPVNYMNFNGVFKYNVGSLSGFPTISWSVDTYNVWLAQNTDFINLKMSQAKDNLGFSKANNMLQTVDLLGSNISSLSGGFNPQQTKQSAIVGGVGALTNTISGVGGILLNNKQNQVNYEYLIKNQVAEMEYHAKLPDEGNFGDNGTTLIGYDLFDKNIFTVYTIKPQFAKIIDDYFSMYGYATNQVKIPNLNSRPNWNYVKCVNANILGNIPDEDLMTIRSLFNNGITLWHNPNTFLDYAQNNK